MSDQSDNDESFEDDEDEERSDFCCPLCNADLMYGNECQHYFCSNDDITLAWFLDAAGASDLESAIDDLDQDELGNDLSAFIERFRLDLPSLLESTSNAWSGTGPISGSFSVVWCRDRESLADEVQSLLRRILAQVSERVGAESDED